MNYRVYFTNGHSVLIREWFKQFIDEQSFDGLLRDIRENIYINTAFVTHIIPEQQVPSGVAQSPTPAAIREKEKEKQDAIKSDPKEILNRATEKYDEK